MVEIGSVASKNTNLSLRPETAASATRTYAQFGKNMAADVDTQTLSFEDFIDTINPLQHIPVLSSAYRAISGESISPVSRIAGDTLYGGIFGVASAALSAGGAIADEVVAAGNDGQSASETIVAALFESDPSTQVAAAKPRAAAPLEQQDSFKVALFQTPATQSPILDMPDVAKANAEVAETTVPLPVKEPVAVASAAQGPTASDVTTLDRSKLPYGGVMDSSMMASAKQNQALALALAGKRDAMQAQRALRNSRFETAPAASADTQRTAENQAALQNLLKDIQTSKGISQYENAAQRTPLPGSSVNITN